MDDETYRGKSKTEQLFSITEGLVAFIRRNSDIPIIGLSQLNRDDDIHGIIFRFDQDLTNLADRR